jgi:nitrile hydratase subunit beta
MDGVHDLGGKQGFGPVRYQTTKAVFKAAWEPRANALYSLGVRLGLINMDEYRHAIERMEPRHYLSASYYERSLTGFATLCVEKGLVTREELERRAGGAFPLSLPSAEGRRNAVPRESFAIGDKVRVKNEFVSGHVRMPGYIRGKTGIVVDISPSYPFPDAAAHNLRAPSEPTYDVRFRTEDLWPQAADKASVHVGVFESYLERAP